jgi:hypothetical protein
MKVTPKRVKWLMINSRGYYEIQSTELNQLNSYTYGDTEILHPPKSIRRIIKEIFKIKRASRS